MQQRERASITVLDYATEIGQVFSLQTHVTVTALDYATEIGQVFETLSSQHLILISPIAVGN